jgi:hypothetical protein
MSEIHAHTVGFVRRDMIPETDPPLTETGAIKWASGEPLLLLVQRDSHHPVALCRVLDRRPRAALGCLRDLGRRFAYRMPRDPRPALWRGVVRRLLGGHHQSLEPASIRLLSKPILLAPHSRARGLSGRHSARDVRPGAETDLPCHGRRTLSLLLAALGGLDLGTARRCRRIRNRVRGLPRRQHRGRKSRGGHRGARRANPLLVRSGRAADTCAARHLADRDHLYRVKGFRRLHAGRHHRRDGHRPVAAPGYPARAGAPV